MKKIILTAALSAGVLFAAGAAFAQEHGQHQGMEMGNSQAPAATVAPKAVDAGNTVCPVTGENIDQSSKVTVEYKGKSYNLCCSSCIEEFNKDPEKYIKKIQEQESKQ